MSGEVFRKAKIFFTPLDRENYEVLEILGNYLAEEIVFIDAVTPQGAIELTKEGLRLEELHLII